jgi:hypothetical protein
VRDWSARLKRNLDHCAGGLLSARPDNLLGAAEVRRLGSPPVSHAKHVAPRGIGDITVVRSPKTRGPRRMVGRRTMGVAPRDGAISRLGD